MVSLRQTARPPRALSQIVSPCRSICRAIEISFRGRDIGVGSRRVASGRVSAASRIASRLKHTYESNNAHVGFPLSFRFLFLSLSSFALSLPHSASRLELGCLYRRADARARDSAENHFGSESGVARERKRARRSKESNSAGFW